MISHFKRRDSIYLYISLILVVIGYAAAILFKTRPIDVYSMEKAGLFGDSFGVITCFFTALGFIGLLINLKEQRTYNNRQVFETNFFQMLSHLNEITKDVGYTKTHMTDPDSIYYGREAVFHLANIFKNYYGYNLFRSQGNYDKDRLENVIINFESFWDDHGGKLSHYFRWLYNILNFIESKDDIDKDFYVKLIFAQLSNQELFLIFYSALTPRGFNFQKFIIKYQMMSNFESSELLDESHSKFMSEANFWNKKRQ